VPTFLQTKHILWPTSGRKISKNFPPLQNYFEIFTKKPRGQSQAVANKTLG
jgi:hypothetical protein